MTNCVKMNNDVNMILEYLTSSSSFSSNALVLTFGDSDTGMKLRFVVLWSLRQHHVAS